MEELIELVSASLARHGVECPESDSRIAAGRVAPETGAIAAAGAAERSAAVEPTALPEHNFRNHSRPDPTP
jgi:hypothetical protein